MFGLLAAFSHRAEMRESKDEMLLGEIVRAMARQGYPSIQFRAGNDRQTVRFKAVTDPVLHTVTIVLDRKTGSGAISSAILGSKATLKVTTEILNRVADPDDLIDMYKTDFANIFKMPVMGDEGVARMVEMLSGTVDQLKDKLQPYKR